ncbi:hypothetical protein Leryth_015224 [Lithospermum erythrorhizon]|nr:hypothetical protein Leryth_015224 [Lithospermum erythrorhizon]
MTHQESVSVADLVNDSSNAISSIFILAGQSNMSGRGGVINGTWDGVVPSQCSPNPSILSLNAEFRWVEAQEPLHKRH